MKSLRIFTIALALVVVAGVAASRPASAGVSFDFFYSNLSHHGSWLVSGSYGRVWQPSVYRTGWNPYYDGHWESTDAGWCWDSDYEWGDIPYHYGTWVEDDEAGWVWVPGYTWAPSWVEFREGPDYIGWAPVSPSFSIGVSFGGGYHYRPSAFTFVRSHDFLCDRVRSYAVPRNQVNIIVNRTKIVNNNIRIENNVVVNRGPSVGFVERATRRRVDTVPIDRAQSVRRLDARGLSRQDIRVNDRGGRGLRAAEPFPSNRPLPSGRLDADRGDRSNRDRGGRFDDRGGRDVSRSDDFRGRDRGVDRTDPRDRGELRDRGRPVPEGIPRTRDDLQRGRDRQQARTTDDAFRRGRMERPDRGTSPPQGSFDDRGSRSRSADRDRGADRPAPRMERDRASGRPDEGRMFRGVRERQSAPRAERSAPDRQRMSDRSRERSSDRGRSQERKGRSSDRPRDRKDNDRNR